MILLRASVRHLARHPVAGGPVRPRHRAGRGGGGVDRPRQRERAARVRPVRRRRDGAGDAPDRRRIRRLRRAARPASHAGARRASRRAGGRGLGGSKAAPGRTLQLLGVDPFSEAPFRPYLARRLGQGLGAPSRTLVTEPGAVLLSRETAGDLGVRAGDTLVLRVSGRERPVRVVALIEPENARSAQALRNLVVADVTTAQEVLGPAGPAFARRPRPPGGSEGRRSPGPPAGGPASRSRDRGGAGAERVRRGADARLRREPDRALAPGADGRPVPRVQHHDVLGRPAPRDDRDAEGPRRHARGDRRRGPRRGAAPRRWWRRPSGWAPGWRWPAGWCDSSPGRSTTSTSSSSCATSRCRRRLSPRARPSGSGRRWSRRSLPAAEASTAPPGRGGPAGRAGGPRAPGRAAGRAGGSAGAPHGRVGARDRGPEPRLELRGALHHDPGRRAPHAARDDRRGAGGGSAARRASRPDGTHGGARRRREALAHRRGGGRAHGGGLGDRRRRRDDPQLPRDGRALARDLAGRPTCTCRRPTLRSGRGGESTLAPGGRRAPPRDARRRGPSAPIGARASLSEFGPTQLVALGIGPGSYGQFRFLAGEPGAVWPAFQERGAAIVSESYAYRHGLAVGRASPAPHRSRRAGLPGGGRVRRLRVGSGCRDGEPARPTSAYWDDRGVSSLGVVVAPGADP